jgi:hypothetical protein
MRGAQVLVRCGVPHRGEQSMRIVQDQGGGGVSRSVDVGGGSVLGRTQEPLLPTCCWAQ